MEEWIGDNIDRMEAVAKEGLCDRCLGRMFAKLGTGMTNDVRGRFIREALKDAPDYVISTKAYCYDRKTAQEALDYGLIDKVIAKR